MCEWEAGKQDDNAPMRTLENIKLNNDAWMAAGAVQSELKKFKNCRHPPLSLFPSTGAVEEWVSRSDLHLELGVTNHLYREGEVIFPEIAEWAATLHISKAGYHGQQFEGRQRRKLFFNVPVLQKIVNRRPSLRIMRSNSEKVEHPMQPFVDAFSAFNNVRDACFGF